MCLDYFKTRKPCCKVQNPFYFIKMTHLWFRLWPGMFSLCWQSVWRQHQSCDSNHEAASDPARSLSGFASFSSQGIFGILVSDTLIVMGRPGFQWSAWISILLGSACWASATWCNRSLSCLQCWQSIGGVAVPANPSSVLSLSRREEQRPLFLPWAFPLKCWCDQSASATLELYSTSHTGVLYRMSVHCNYILTIF